MTTAPPPDAYFNGILGWLGVPEDVRDAMHGMQEPQIDRKRSLEDALFTHGGRSTLGRVVFIDWKAVSTVGPFAGVRVGGMLVPRDEADDWVRRHEVARENKEQDSYNEIHSVGYPLATLEIPIAREERAKWGQIYDPRIDPAKARLWVSGKDLRYLKRTPDRKTRERIRAWLTNV